MRYAIYCTMLVYIAVIGTIYGDVFLAIFYAILSYLITKIRVSRNAG